MSRPKILLVTPTYPGAHKSGGLLKTAKLIEKLEIESELTVVCLYSQTSLRANAKHKLVVLTNQKGSKKTTFVQLFLSYLRNLPVAVQRNYTRSLSKYLKVKYSGFDKVIVDHYLLAYPFLSDFEFFYHAHNAEYVLYDTYYNYDKSGSRLKRVLAWIESKRVKEYERKVIESARLTFAAPPDIQCFNQQGFKGIYSETFHLGESFKVKPLLFHERSSDILILGSSEWLPNKDGLVWFLDYVWPYILDHTNVIKLKIIGKTPSVDAEFFKTYKNVEVLGYVDDLEYFLSSSKLSIVPIRIGAGMKVKMITSAFAKLPFVSTTHGVSGLSNDLISKLPVSDDPQQFANKILMLIENAERWEEQVAYMELICNRYTWDRVLNDFWRAINEN